MITVTHNGRTGRWAENPSDWGEVRREVYAAGACGFDTEYHGIDVRTQSPLLAKVHVWSLAILTNELHPRGYRKAKGWTLPVSALHHFESLLTGDVKKIAHNAPVDIHSVYGTTGWAPENVWDSLSFARWMWPELKVRGGFGLKALMPEKLGRAPLGAFTDLFSRPTYKTKTRKVKLPCTCGADGCRKRSAGHVRGEALEEIQVDGPREQVPLEEIVPGHPLFELLVVYAQEDAEAAIELFSLWQKPSSTLGQANR